MPSDSRIIWTEDLKAEVVRLYKEDGLYASKICEILCARGLNATRNSVVGVLNRGRVFRSSAPKAVRQVAKAARPKKQKPSMPVVSIEDVDSPTLAPVTHLQDCRSSTEAVNLPLPLLDLKPHHCRWPIDTPEGAILFCGHDAREGKPYCPAHSRLAYRNPYDRSSDAAEAA